MSRLIDFSNYQPPADNHQKNVGHPRGVQISQARGNSGNTNETNMQLLVLTNPGKIYFTLEEVGDHINKGAEFIRRRIKSGLILTKYFGDSQMIHITELARILTEGID